MHPQTFIDDIQSFRAHIIESLMKDAKINGKKISGQFAIPAKESSISFTLKKENLYVESVHIKLNEGETLSFGFKEKEKKNEGNLSASMAGLNLNEDNSAGTKSSSDEIEDTSRDTNDDSKKRKKRTYLTNGLLKRKNNAPDTDLHDDRGPKGSNEPKHSEPKHSESNVVNLEGEDYRDIFSCGKNDWDQCWKLPTNLLSLEQFEPKIMEYTKGNGGEDSRTVLQNWGRMLQGFTAIYASEASRFVPIPALLNDTLPCLKGDDTCPQDWIKDSHFELKNVFIGSFFKAKMTEFYRPFNYTKYYLENDQPVSINLGSGILNKQGGYQKLKDLSLLQRGQKELIKDTDFNAVHMFLHNWSNLTKAAVAGPHEIALKGFVIKDHENADKMPLVLLNTLGIPFPKIYSNAQPGKKDIWRDWHENAKNPYKNPRNTYPPTISPGKQMFLSSPQAMTGLTTDSIKTCTDETMEGSDDAL